MPLIFFGALIKPVWMDPFLNEYGPLKDKALESSILELAHRAGIDGGRVLEVNMSRDTKSMDAKVVGFRLDDIASLPLILLLLNLALLLLRPTYNALLRYQEHEERIGSRWSLRATVMRSVDGVCKADPGECLGLPRHGWLFTAWRDTPPFPGRQTRFLQQNTTRGRMVSL